VCGFPLSHFFHWFGKPGEVDEGNGVLCAFVDEFMDYSKDSCFSNRCVLYPLVFFMINVGVPVIYTLFMALMPIGWLCYSMIEGLYWACRLSGNTFFLFWLLYPFTLIGAVVWAVIKIVGCTIGATLALILVFLIEIFYVPVLIWRFCLCNSHKRNLDNQQIEQLLESRRIRQNPVSQVADELYLPDAEI
jgi:hypothetical protein